MALKQVFGKSGLKSKSLIVILLSRYCFKFLRDFNLPSFVFGPVDKPAWFGHLYFFEVLQKKPLRLQRTVYWLRLVKLSQRSGLNFITGKSCLKQKKRVKKNKSFLAIRLQQLNYTGDFQSVYIFLSHTLLWKIIIWGYN